MKKLLLIAIFATSTFAQAGIMYDTYTSTPELKLILDGVGIKCRVDVKSVDMNWISNVMNGINKPHVDAAIKAIQSNKKHEFTQAIQNMSCPLSS